MKTTFDDKWRIGMFFPAGKGSAREHRTTRYRGWMIFAVTLFVSCVAFGGVIGIREPYIRAFRLLAAAGFLLALLPVAGEAADEWRRGTVNLPTVAVAAAIVAALLLSLFFPF